MMARRRLDDINTGKYVVRRFEDKFKNSRPSVRSRTCGRTSGIYPSTLDMERIAPREVMQSLRVDSL